MGGSGAGLNRLTAVMLSVQNGSTATVGAPRTNYGIIGLNDSGTLLAEARDYTKWTFSLTGAGSGYSFTLLGTNDPLAYAAWKASFNPQAYPNGTPVVPASSWFVLDSPSVQSGTGVVGNPLTDATPLLQFSGSLIAVRAVLTATSSASGVRNVVAEAAP